MGTGNIREWALQLIRICFTNQHINSCHSVHAYLQSMNLWRYLVEWPTLPHPLGPASRAGPWAPASPASYSLSLQQLYTKSQTCWAMWNTKQSFAARQCVVDPIFFGSGFGSHSLMENILDFILFVLKTQRIPQPKLKLQIITIW